MTRSSSAASGGEPTSSSARPWRLTLLAASVLLLGACASAPATAPAAGAGAGAPAPAASSASVASAPGAAAVRPGAAPALPPFARVIEQARRIPGVLDAWQKDDKVWIELSEQDFDRPFFLSPKLASGIGEAGVLGGLMAGRFGPFGGPQWIEFRRVHQQVQMIARNAESVARAGTPAARAVAAAYSPSLLGSTTLASLPHPERRTVLVEANSLFLGDMPGVAMQLQRSFRQGYGHDVRHSAITGVRGQPQELVIEVQNHYATGSLASPGPSTAPGAPAPSVPDMLPDARSLFVKVQYSITRLPATPMAPRRADARLGHFTTSVSDFSDDLARTPRQRFVNRWRLDKRDPAAALSEPVQPITYWIDRSVPVGYRAAITAGILEWNRAFERIGFKDAIRVQVQPDDARDDTLDTGKASVRWMTNAQAQFGAIGPTHVDPRSGEILDADIALESLSSRGVRAYRTQYIDRALLDAASADLPAFASRPEGLHALHDASCQHADQAAEQLAYGLDLAAVRDGIEPDSPQAEAFVQAYLKEVTMHEVGHTLGLRHNFRASRVYGERQIADPASTVLAGSVMEYLPINLARRGEPAPTPFQTTLGPYDYWAIEYAYRTWPAADEAGELARVAARSSEPELAFGTDEDSLFGLDPETLQNDQGDDPVAFVRRRFDIAGDLIRRLEATPLRADDSYARLRRTVSFALRDVARSSAVLLRQIGGIRMLRDAPGSGRDPMVPVPPDRQLEALDLIASRVFAADALPVSAALQRRLAPDYLARADGPGADTADYNPADQVLELQRGLLGQLMSDALVQRLLSAQAKTAPGEPSLSLVELHERLARVLWSELAQRGGDIPLARRELQRDHLGRLAVMLLRPASQGRADAQALARSEAQALLLRLQAASGRPGWSPQARLHLQAGQDLLREALAARLNRLPG